MGYTTDANYLIQASKDIGTEVDEADRASSDFDGRSDLPMHEWGPYAIELDGPYRSVRAGMLACMVRVAVLLDSHSRALKQAGELYLDQERAAQQRFGGI